MKNLTRILEHDTSVLKKIWYRLVYSPQGFALYLLLSDFRNWEYGSHTITHKSGLTMWISNGSWFFDGYKTAGTPKFLGIIERHLLYSRFKKMYAKRMLWDAERSQ